MKGIFKLMTAALAVGALASCSDELDVQKAAQQARQQADLVGHLNASTQTRVGIKETAWSDDDRARLSAYDLLWTEGDQVRVFTLDAQTYNTYLLDPATAGTKDGAFSKTKDFKPIYEGDLYAMTEGQFVYAISPDADGDPRLTMTIPASYDMDEDLLNEQGINKFPAPFWGKATVTGSGDNYQLDATFDALTCFLRLNLNTLPIGTKAIVLTTHGSRTSHMPTGSGSEAEGFQLATKAEMVAGGYAADDDELIPRDQYMDWYNSGENFVTGGQSEPLSGALEGKLVGQAKLGYSNILVSSDTIRVNLQNIPELEETGRVINGVEETQAVNDDKVIYIPIVAGQYHNLHVIAVTEDSPFSYQWIGEELEMYNDEVFKVNTIKQLVMKVDVDVSDCTDWQDLSDAIYNWSVKKPNRILNVNIPEAVVAEGGELYIDNTMTRNDVVLNWPAGYDLPDGESLVIKEMTVSDYDLDRKGERVDIEWAGTTADPDPDAAMRYITLNLAPNCAQSYEFETPTSVVTIGTTDGMNNEDANVKVLAAEYNPLLPASTLNDPTLEPGVSGLDLLSSSRHDVTMDRKNATVLVKNGIGSLDIDELSEGDVYVYSGGYEETEIAEYMAIRTVKPIKTRLTDALVYNIWVSNSENNKRYLFTTGSSAIGIIKTLTDVEGDITIADPYDAASSAGTHVADADKPKNFHVVAYWTGAALQPAAIAKYDKAYVYTAAQLASAGENTTSDYAIPEGVVTEMWLGGEKYPWIGAQVDVDEFKFDGRRVSLQNMTLEIGDDSFIDPHHCCTSCGDLRKINLTENLGLFRSIESETSAELDSINLNDVYLTTEEPINNIGSIAGLIASPVVKMDKNQVGEVKIDVNGNNIGGMVGLLQGYAGDDAALTMNDNKVTKGNDGKNTGWIVSDKGNVGGQIGYAQVSTATITNSLVDLKKEITAGKYNAGTKARPEYVSRVGGIVGLMEATDEVAITKPSVTVKERILGDQKQVGGIAGFIDGEDAVAITEGKVETPLIKSVEAGFVGGGVGQLDDEESTVTGNQVKADNILAKTDYVGGVAGRLNDEGSEPDFSGNTVAGKTEGTNVTIKTEQKNAGGLIGFSNVTGQGGVLTIKNASVTAGLIEATEGYAGGEIGTQHDGIVKIGNEGTDDKTYNTAITVSKLSGAYALGGLVGDNEDPLYVFSSVTDAANKKWSKIQLAIADWETKKNEAYYDADNESDHRAGTMSNIVGYLDDNLYVYETPNYLTVADALTAAKKTALFFKVHKNRQYTTDEVGFYWGDQNGYVGWGHSGNYYINSNGVNADQTDNYNLYKTADTYNTNSKWVAAH